MDTIWIITITEVAGIGEKVGHERCRTIDLALPLNQSQRQRRPLDLLILWMCYFFYSSWALNKKLAIIDFFFCLASTLACRPTTNDLYVLARANCIHTRQTRPRSSSAHCQLSYCWQCFVSWTVIIEWDNSVDRLFRFSLTSTSLPVVSETTTFWFTGEEKDKSESEHKKNEIREMLWNGKSSFVMFTRAILKCNLDSRRARPNKVEGVKKPTSKRESLNQWKFISTRNISL